MTPELMRRIAAAFRGGSASLDERATLQKAAVGARNVDDMPPEAVALLAELERRTPRIPVADPE